ncbi:GTP cyclohydrolase II [Histoplasma capsulatum G186AR]|uniref:GTP cyclohydrolase II n=2 Tax=Ajellomyces capsulatus TaxID=5037 RepID=C0NRE9_AJECG|nr:GTP cyclohydrolase II [Histoplasma capsulatum G186AR]EEH06263.1 GTP cyclohydrolase II [Histoplasma capsulatum G186AR]KAG5293282.1 GTP cyclohydrolase II [Histoplasma capsulatum]QSS74733.1 GTP cyclohydrolase II [Histoplasma capsulatum G186AR]
MSELPSHASPCLSPRPLRPTKPTATKYSLPEGLNNARTSSPSSPTRDRSLSDGSTQSTHDYLEIPSQTNTPTIPHSLISPAFTPPATPYSLTNAYLPTKLSSSTTEYRDRMINTKPPKLLPRLPKVECIVRARIPTTGGAEMFLHLYHNDVDNKEHLAIVFGSSIQSRSLNRVRPGETEMDRMIRGAYVGRLYPGRQNSRVDGGMVDRKSSYGSQGAARKESSTGGVDSLGQVVDGPVQKNEMADQSKQIPAQVPLVRIHSECYTGETAWSARCDCGEQLDEAARLMSEATSSYAQSAGGVIIYLRQEGRGIGLSEKLKAYNLQDLGNDTVEANLILRHPADARSYGLATAMLVDLGLGADSQNNNGIRLLTNNPDKVIAVEGPNREVIVKERVPMIPLAWRSGGQKGIRSSEIEEYLRTKIGKMGHMLE